MNDRPETDRRRPGRNGTGALAGVALAALLAGGPALGQEAFEDIEDLHEAHDPLRAPLELRRSKRGEAKRTGTWTWTGAATMGGGFDSNIHLSPSDREGSALASVGARIDALKYFGPAHRLKLTMVATGTPYAETSDVSPYVQEAKVFYGYRPGSGLSLTFSTGVEHRNDPVTTIEGTKLVRDFSYTSYDLKTSVELRLSELNSLRVSYIAKRKDYAETSRLNSLDWWEHRGRIEHELSLTDTLEVETFYSFARQRYAEEPAALASGIELPGNPHEVHHFHRVGVDLRWQVLRDLEVLLGYAFKRKDDRFEGYESYDDHSVSVELGFSPGSRWRLEAEASFAHRDYDHRPSSETRPLEYDKWLVSVGAAYLLSDHASLFADYVFQDRDTNRSIPFTTYRDYERHRVLGGFTVAY